jgi:hypothetical protein
MPGNTMYRIAPSRHPVDMISRTPQPSASALELHRAQRALVAASLLACPGSSKPAHRRWL